MTQSSVNIASFIGAVFLSLGVHLPFFPLWLETQGFSSVEIAALLSIPLCMKVVFTPLATAYAGRLPKRRSAAQLYCTFALTTFAAVYFLGDFWAALVFLSVFTVFFASLIPLGDSFALTAVRCEGANYGTMRLWGSLTFVVANLCAGLWLSRFDASLAHLIITLTLSLALVSAFFLPSYGLTPDQRPQAPAGVSSQLARFFKRPHFLAIAVSAGLIQGSHAMLYSFSTIEWTSRGYGAFEIGSFWAIGVVAEIILFTQARPLFERVSPAMLLLIGGMAACLRWSLHGTVDGVFAILTLQFLHGLTFGATHLAVQSFIASDVREEDTSAAQGFVVFIAGVVMAILTMLSGGIYAQFSSGAYVVMTFVAGLGLLPLLFLRQPHKEGEGG